MPFGVIGRTGTRMRQIVWFGDRSTGSGTFGGEFGARHCNQWGLYTAYVCNSAATRPSSQITLGRLVITARRAAKLLYDVSDARAYNAYIQKKIYQTPSSAVTF